MDNLANLNELDSISMDELQSQLITWVQEKGLLNELRAYLRKKMIFLLKDTLLDHKTCVINQLCVTPKLQAISLLVAEYLLSQQLFYSLSVFSTEVPTITHVNKFCQQIQNTNDKNQKAPKLDSNEITHILEAIGISNHTELQEKIVNAYENAEDRKVSLLACIAEAVSASSYNLTGKKLEKVIQGTNTDELFDSTRSINTIADLNLLFEDYQLKKYQTAVFKFMEKEHNRTKAEERARYKSRINKQQKQLYQQMKIREEFVLKKLNEAETHLLTQKQQIEANLKRKQGKLQELADELNMIHAQLANREAAVQEALKRNSNTNLCEKCQCSKQVQKKKSSKSSLEKNCGNNKNSQENLSASKGVCTNTKVSETACERKLFSDVIMSLQQENASLRDQTLRNQSSIIKLRTKLAKKKSTYGCSRQSLVQQVYVPLPEVCRPCNNHSPKIYLEKEIRVSQENQSVKEQHLAKRPEKLPSPGVDNKEPKLSIKETIERKKSNELSQGNGLCDYIRPFIPERTRLKHKSEIKSSLEIETKQKLEVSSNSDSQPNSEIQQLTELGQDTKAKLQQNKEVKKKNEVDEKRETQKTEVQQQKLEVLKQKIDVLQQKIEVEQQELQEQQQQIEDIQKIEVKQKTEDQQHTNILKKKQFPEKVDDKIQLTKRDEEKCPHTIQIPNVILDTDMVENTDETFKDIVKKMKPLEDCILYSKRIPNIYYAESCADSSSYGDRHQGCAKCILENEKKLGEAIQRDMNLKVQPEHCCSKSTYDIAGIKFCRLNPNLKENESEVSFKSDSSKSSHALLPRSRKHRKSHINPANIEDMDENELFKKVCTSLGVPFAPITKKDSPKNELTKQKDRIASKFSLIFEQNEVTRKNKKLDLPSMLLDESSLSTCSENSRDCATPESLILELDGCSLLP